MENTNQPPTSIEAEYAVLGSVLKDAKALDEVVVILPDENAFYFFQNKIIYKAVLKLYQQSKPVDITTVAEEITDKEELEKIGGQTYLIDLINGVATTANVGSYAEIVLNKYYARQLIGVCAKAQQHLYEQDEPLQDIVNGLDHSLLNIVNDRESNVIHVGIIASELADKILKGNPADFRETYIETRIADLNRSITGIFKGDLTVLAGPPSMGKTSLAIDIPLFSKCKCLYFGLDETSIAIAGRVLTSHSQISRREMLSDNPPLKSDKIKSDRLADASVKAGQSNIYICDNTQMTVYDIRAKTRQHQRKYGLDMIIVDYIQQIKHHGKQYESQNMKVTEQVRVLKDIAKELNIAVVAISQLNREYSNQPINPAKNRWGFPHMSHLRDSGTIEQEGNLILFVWNTVKALKIKGMEIDDPCLKGEQIVDLFGNEKAFIVVAKNKTGELGQINCMWNPTQMRFYSEDKHHGKPTA